MKLDLKTLYRIILVTLVLCSTNVLQAKSLYWVGGSGTWSNIDHWSLTSGGNGGSAIPSIEDNLVFDSASNVQNGTVAIYGNTAANSLTVNDNIKFSITSTKQNVLVFDAWVDFGSVENNQIKGVVHLLNHHTSQAYKKYNAESFIGFLENGGKGVVDEVLTVTSVTFTVTNQTCPSAQDGSILVVPDDGGPNFSYSWILQGTCTTALNLTTNNVTQVCGGEQAVLVTDLSDGTVGFFKTNVGPSEIAAVINALETKNVTCPGGADGTVTPRVFGGVGPYTFSWSNGSTDSVITGVGAGRYTVTVTDANGCLAPTTANDSVEQPDPIVITPLASDIPLCGSTGCTEDVTFTASGGNGGPFVISGINPVIAAPVSLVNICPGSSYQVATTDNLGCPQTFIHTASNPPTIALNATQTRPVTCQGVSDGEATAVASMGSGNYTYLWLNAPGNPTTATVVGLATGTYNVEATDVATGCTVIASVTIIPPISISLASKIDIACGGSCTGVIEVNGTGGNGTYTYNWYDMTGTPTPNAANDRLTGICAGTYNIEISDGTAGGCLDTLQVTINQPPSSVINVDRQVNNTCSTNCNGELDVSVSGGAAPVVSLWTDSNSIVPVNPQLTNLTGLCNGTYTYEATDNDGCVTTRIITISSPQTTVNFSLSPLCPGDLVANAQALATGGTAPYVYTWLSPVTGNINNNVQIGLTPGSYNLQVVDANGCTDIFNLTFGIPLPIVGSAVVTNALCQGVCNGVIDATIVGGTSPYKTVWYNMAGSPTTEDLVNVCNGSYNMAIEDNNGCRDTLKAVAVNAITAITSTSAEIQATCNGLCNGKVWVTASNGVPNYTYNWYDAPVGNAVLDTAFNMCVGNYNVEITDQQGCVDTVLAPVTAPLVTFTSFINTQQNVCSQDCNGATEVSIVGGTAPMAISWLNITGNPTTPAVNGLCNGAYRVEVTDANGCKDLDTIVISSQAGTVTFTTVDPTCGGYNDGSITATIVPGPVGLPIPTLEWYGIPGKPTSNFVSGLKQGTYNLEVTDLNGCIDTFPAVLTDPFPAIALQIDSQVVSCFGLCDGKAWTTPSGGVGPFVYSWYDASGVISITDTLSLQCIGKYFLDVEDSRGCKASSSVSITDPFVINLSNGSKDPCYNVCDGRVTTLVTGEVRPFTYAWNNGITSTDSALTGLCAGFYEVTVTSATPGCSAKKYINLVENTEIKGVLASAKALCTNITNGSASIIPTTGGQLPHQFLWTDSGAYTSTLPNPNDLAIGKYVVVVTDAIGCTYTDSVIITETYVVLPNAGADTAICEGDSVTIVGSGGVSYLWSNGDTTSTIVVNPEVTAEYTLTVTNNVCTDDDIVRVVVNLNPTAYATTDKDALLEGFNLSTTIRGDGAGQGGTYDWTPPTGLSDPTSATPTASPLVSTTYHLTVTDENGCKDTTSTHIRIIDSIEFPDGVSPNGDGINDTWPIIYIENFPGAVVEIYNRWGQLLFHSEGYLEQWDGTVDGKSLPVGTYYYVIDLGNDLPNYTGPITIFR